jgi:hypothetical protein
LVDQDWDGNGSGKFLGVAFQILVVEFYDYKMIG